MSAPQVFVDQPLDPVVQDNLSIDCFIGGRPYHIVDLEVHLTAGSDSNWAKGDVVPDGHDYKPDPGDPLEGESPDQIIIDVDNELMELRDGNEITRIFTGVISNASRVEQGLFEFMAFWPGFNQIQNGSIIVQPPSPLLENLGESDGGGASLSSVSFTNRLQKASDIAEQIGDFVTQDTGFGYSVNLFEEGIDINGTLAGVDTRMNVDGEKVPLVTSGNDDGLLERIIKSTNSVWDVDRYGEFSIGPPAPDGTIPTAVRAHKLRYITDTTAGKQSPAWQSIVVIGDGVVSQDGWGASAQINENPPKFTSPITATGAAASVEEGVLAEPTFQYTNLEIDTAEEAEHVLGKLRDEIKKQRAGGTVTVVGHPEVWPGDAIELPDSRNQPFGLERFAISKVTHRLNNSDGFLTEIEVMGQTDAVQSMFSDEVEFTNDRYDTYFSEEELDRIESGLQSGL